MSGLDAIKTFLFIDEVKNSRLNGDLDDSFYYFAVAVPKLKLLNVTQQFEVLRIGLIKGFHAKDQYKLKRINTDLLNNMTEMMLTNDLFSFCFKYDKDRFYDLSKKYLPAINNFEIQAKINNWEFQAFFYFVQTLDNCFKNKEANLEFPVCLFADRGIYGLDDDQDIDIDSVFIGRTAFTSNSKIKLLALPDHLGFVFSQCRKQFHACGTDLKELNNNIFGQQIVKLMEKRLFKFLDVDKWFKDFGASAEKL